MAETKAVRARFEHATPIVNVASPAGSVRTWVGLGVDDVKALHDEYLQRGATILQPRSSFSEHAR
jgi:hypothetical protein